MYTRIDGAFVSELHIPSYLRHLNAYINRARQFVVYMIFR